MKTSPLSLLNDPTLLKCDALIAGQWVGGDARFDVNDPATGAKLADVSNLGPVDAEAAIGAAAKAWPAWHGKTGKERSVIMRKWFELLMDNQEDLGRIMTAEQGKPFAEDQKDFFARVFDQRSQEFDELVSVERLVNDHPARLALVGHRSDH